MSSPLEAFLLGLIMAGYGMVAVHFLRFWHLSGDRFFLLFAAAFAMLSLNQVGFMMTGDEAQTPFYFIRLAAYLLILAAVVQKNVSVR